MALIKHKPTTSARRQLTTVDYRSLSKSRPHKKLVRGQAERAGRNHQGRITVRHRGAGNKRKYRQVDLVQNKYDVPGRVESVEYDPYRTCFIALVLYRDGERRYLAVPEGVKAGQKIMSSQKKIDLHTGNRMPLKYMPSGTIVSQIELRAGEGAQIARAAGNQAVLLSKEGAWVHIKMPSGEVRKFNKDVAASLGQASNVDHSNIEYGKAGRRRWLRRRPH